MCVFERERERDGENYVSSPSNEDGCRHANLSIVFLNRHRYVRISIFVITSSLFQSLLLEIETTLHVFQALLVIILKCFVWLALIDL